MLLLVALPAVHAESGLNRIGLVHAVQTDRIEGGCRATLSAQAGFAVTAQQALDRLPSHLCIGKVPAQIWIDDTSYYFCKRCDGQATEEEVRGVSYIVNGTSGDVEVVPEYGL